MAGLWNALEGAEEFLWQPVAKFLRVSRKTKMVAMPILETLLLEESGQENGALLNFAHVGYFLNVQMVSNHKLWLFYTSQVGVI